MYPDNTEMFKTIETFVKKFYWNYFYISKGQCFVTFVNIVTSVYGKYIPYE